MEDLLLVGRAQAAIVSNARTLVVELSETASAVSKPVLFETPRREVNNRRIQLLEHMRKSMRSAEDHLRQVAKTVRSKLRGDGSHAPKIKSARFIFDNIRVVIDDDDGCSVYEDPPGICRPCKPGE